MADPGGMLWRLGGPVLSFLVALGFQLSGFESLPVAIVLWSVAILWVLAAFLTAPRVRQHLPRVREGVPGWDSKVTEVTPSPKYPGFWMLLFRLYGPDGQRANGLVTCEVVVGGQTFSSTPQFEEIHLHPGETPHYRLWFPEDFQGAGRPDGRYELRWHEAYGLSRRLLAKPHRFTIKKGRLRGARPE